jgi:hypothetical protein
VGHKADWRSSLLSHWDVINRILEKGERVNPLLQAPWFHSRIVRADWLHACDQGVTADFLGNLFHACQAVAPGSSVKVRTQVLSTKMLDWYRVNNVQDRLDCLLPSHFTQNKKGFKLRASAAVTRALVPFGVALASELLGESPQHKAMKSAAIHLNNVYASLHNDSFFFADLAREESVKFALLYVALHDYLHDIDDRAFRIKPKLHLFLHITSDGSRPALYWNYRDEDWGGSVARLAHRQGGAVTALSCSSRVLSHFVQNQPVYHIRL